MVKTTDKDEKLPASVNTSHPVFLCEILFTSVLDKTLVFLEKYCGILFIPKGAIKTFLFVSRENSLNRPRFSSLLDRSTEMAVFGFIY